MNYRYFSERDTALSCRCGCGKGIDDMDISFMAKLDEARNIAKIPFVLTSGYRCPSYNASVSYTGNSGPHTKGHAVDIKATSSRARYRIVNALFAVGFTRLGIGKGMIHVDDDPSKDPEVIWEY